MMIMRRFPIIGAALLAAIFLGVLIFSFSGTKATPLGPTPPIHNHPTIYFTDGQPAISPHRDKTQLTVADVQQYVSIRPFPAGPTVKNV